MAGTSAITLATTLYITAPPLPTFRFSVYWILARSESSPPRRHLHIERTILKASRRAPGGRNKKGLMQSQRRVRVQDRDTLQRRIAFSARSNALHRWKGLEQRRHGTYRPSRG